MRIVNLTWIFIGCLFWDKDALPMSEITDLRAVTNFPELETFYKQLRDKTQITDEPPPKPGDTTKRARVKKTICEHIFTSHHFRMEAQRWINVNSEDVRLHLEKNHPKFFHLLFVENEIPLEDDYRYENNYTLRTVRTDDDFKAKEFGSTCLTVDGPNNLIRGYFVSRTYNVNILADRPPIVGRFVFTYFGKNQLKLVALAEESVLEFAFLRWTTLVGFVYAHKRVRDKLAEDPQDDPVCHLSDSHKLRLCAILFASESLRNEVIFIPAMENVRAQYELREAGISRFHWAVYARLEAAVFPLLELDRYIAEWVVGCTARVIRTGRQITYYVSRSDGPNTGRAFRRADIISPWNLFY